MVASYDGAGNMTSWNGNEYEFGPFGEIRRVVTSSEEWLHAYTAADERLFSWQVGGAERLRWTLRGLDQRVLREYVVDRSTGVGRIEADNVYRGPGGPLLRSQGPLQTIHFHVDHLGTPRQLTNHAAAEVSFHAYYPYGAEATDPEQNEIRYKFTGHERDLAEPTSTADDLDHMHARMTNPQLGRFLSVDPLGGNPRAPQSWNRYAYVIGNPLKYVDPTGESDEQATPTADKGDCEGFSLFCAVRDWFLGLLPQSQAPQPMQGIEELANEIGLSDSQQAHFDNTATERRAQQGLHEGTADIVAGTVTATVIVGSNAAGRAVAGPLKGLGNIGSHSAMDAGKALGAGQKWLGAGYKEIAPGVFRSADGLRQFRMTKADVLGRHGSIGSHVHFEALNDAGRVIENLHLPVRP